jgi:glycosyltransferase involved in cell wall biosynthesis
LRALIAALDLTDKVFVRGWAPGEQVWRETDLLLFPSRHEGAPNAVLEALGHGIPVLASNIPEHREILPVEDLLPVNDPAPWATALRRLCGPDPAPWLDLVARQQRAAQRLRFDWDAAVRHCILPDGAIPAAQS